LTVSEALLAAVKGSAMNGVRGGRRDKFDLKQTGAALSSRQKVIGEDQREAEA